MITIAGGIILAFLALSILPYILKFIVELPHLVAFAAVYFAGMAVTAALLFWNFRKIFGPGLSGWGKRWVEISNAQCPWLARLDDQLG